MTKIEIIFWASLACIITIVFIYMLIQLLEDDDD